MPYFVYIIENNDKRHYIGITTDPQRRLIEHNSGSTNSTRGFCPWKLIYTEEFATRSEACQREWHLKHSPGREEKLKIIRNTRENPFGSVKIDPCLPAGRCESL